MGTSDADFDALIASGEMDDAEAPAPAEAAPAPKPAETEAPAAEEPAKAAAEEQPKRPELTLEEKAARFDNERGAFRTERQKRREAERAIAERDERIARMEQTFQEFRQRPQQPPAQQQEQPRELTYEDAVSQLWERQQHQDQQYEAQRRAQEQQRAQQEQNTRALQALENRVTEFEDDFREDFPDYDQAAAHLRDTQIAVFEASGYSREQAEVVFGNWAIAIAQSALQAGRNPAEVAYQAAQKLGYQKPAPKPAKAAETLAMRAAGEAEARTLTGGGAGASDGPLTLEYISTLKGAAKDKAFERFLSENA